MDNEFPKKNTLLIVDDNPTNLGVLYNTLNSTGYKLLVAQDGQSALEQADFARPDMILLDVMMPGMDGFEVCRHLKNNPQTKDIPVIFMTSLSETESKVNGFDLGAVDYVTKPLNHQEVVARVQTHLTLRNLYKKLEEKNEQIEAQNAEILAQRDRVIETNALLEEAMRNLCAAQDRLVHAEKMSAIGQMVGGLAHEINNPLGLIQGTLGFLKQHMSHRDEMIQAMGSLCDRDAFVRLKDRFQYGHLRSDADELMGIFQNGASRIRNIVDALQDFSRFDSHNLEFVRIHDEINNVLMSLKSETDHRITIVRKFGVIPAIEGYSGKVSQVFFQVLLNAVQAIHGHGVITVATEADEYKVTVTISDTGEGIKEENQSRIFDPFFTTRDVGKGMGLGLSLCYGIVKSHNGMMEITSAEGRGTTVTIILPVQQPNDNEEPSWMNPISRSMVS